MPRTRLAEIRFRYADGSASTQRAGWHKELLAGLKKQGGAPEKTLSSWGQLWSDLPVQQPRPFSMPGRTIER